MMTDPFFSRRGLSLDRLSSFLRVAEAGGITRAAPDRVVEQSQISRQIRELEEFFGHNLFDRRGRSLVLTPTGLHLAEVARSIFSGLADVAREADQAPALYGFAAGDSVLQWWILPRIGAATGANTFTIGALASSDIADYLIDGRLELGVIAQTSLRAPLKSRPLGTLDYSLFVPRELLLAAMLPLVEQSSEHELQAQLERAAKKAKRDFTAVLSVATFPQAARLVATGKYAAFLPSIARSDLPRAKFAALKLGKSVRRSLVLAWHPSLIRRRPSAERLIDALAASLKL